MSQTDRARVTLVVEELDVRSTYAFGGERTVWVNPHGEDGYLVQISPASPATAHEDSTLHVEETGPDDEDAADDAAQAALTAALELLADREPTLTARHPHVLAGHLLGALDAIGARVVTTDRGRAIP